MKNPFSARSGQGGPEFSVVVGFVMLVFLIIMIIALQKQAETYSLQVFIDAKKVASTIASNINMISQNGHGYYRYFPIPAQLHGYTDYDVEVSGNFLWINYTDTTYSVPLITNNVTILSLIKGENETNCVSNINNQVFINSTTCVLQ